MGIMDKIFGGKTAATITSAALKAEIDRAEREIASLQAKLNGAMAGVATMTDSEHVKMEADIATTRRAIARLDARVGYLTTELPAVIAAEKAAAKAESDAALQARAEACRKVNEKDAARLLTDYDKLASQIGDILEKLKAIDIGRDAVNQALRSTPVAETIASYTDVYRKTPDQIASEHRSVAPHWVYKDAPPQPDEVHPGETEKAYRATLDDAGKPIPPAGAQYGRFGQIISPQLEQREVITKTMARIGRAEHPLADVRLPPSFANSGWHWPRS